MVTGGESCCQTRVAAAASMVKKPPTGISSTSTAPIAADLLRRQLVPQIAQMADRQAVSLDHKNDDVAAAGAVLGVVESLARP